jgi:phosphoglycolate phosphatase
VTLFLIHFGLFDGIFDLRSVLAEFSNKADEFTKKIVLTLLPEWNFEAIVGLSTEVHKKPNPFVPLQISERSGSFLFLQYTCVR